MLVTSSAEPDAQPVAALLLAAPLILLALIQLASVDPSSLPPPHTSPPRPPAAAAEAEAELADQARFDEKGRAGKSEGEVDGRDGSGKDARVGRRREDEVLDEETLWLGASFISTPRCARAPACDIAGEMHSDESKKRLTGEHARTRATPCRRQLGQASRPPAYLPTPLQPLVFRFLDAFWPLPATFDVHVASPHDPDFLPSSNMGQVALRRHALLWAEGLSRLLLLGHKLCDVVTDMAEELGLDLALLLSIASRAGKPDMEPDIPVGDESIADLVRQDSQVLLAVFDGGSMHVEHQLPAVLYLAYRYGDLAEKVPTALTVSASIPGQSCLRTALLGILLGLAHGETHLPGNVKSELEYHLRRKKERDARLELSRLRKRLTRARERAHEAFGDEQARAAGATRAVKEGLTKLLLLREEALLGPDAEDASERAGLDLGAIGSAASAGVGGAGAQQMLVLARLEHKGRMDAAEADLVKRVDAARAKHEERLKELDLEEEHQLKRLRDLGALHVDQRTPDSKTDDDQRWGAETRAGRGLEAGVGDEGSEGGYEAMGGEHARGGGGGGTLGEVEQSLQAEVDSSEDVLALENPRLRVRILRARASVNVGTSGVLIVVNKVKKEGGGDSAQGGDAETADDVVRDESGAGGVGQAIADDLQVKGCVVVLEEEESEDRTLVLQAAGAVAVIYASDGGGGLVKDGCKAGLNSFNHSRGRGATVKLLEPHAVSIPVANIQLEPEVWSSLRGRQGDSVTIRYSDTLELPPAAAIERFVSCLC
jgi:hypothetical protein